MALSKQSGGREGGTIIQPISTLWQRYTTFATMLAAIVVFASPAEALSQPAAQLGLNKYELIKQYLGIASGGDGGDEYREVTRAMAKKAINDAKDAGANFLRFSATGYAPSTYSQPGDLDLWMRDGAAYWRVVDEALDDLEAANVAAVVTFLWNVVQFPAMTGETVRQLIVDEKSSSYRLAQRYIEEFISRYKGRRSILFYELTNELNLGVDLDLVGRCRKQQSDKMCEVKGNYSTEEMIAFTRRLTAVIRALDAERPISSGFSVPRPSAEHLRARPEWSKGGGDFTADRRSQYEKNLRDIHVAFDLVSVHLYPEEGNERFGETDRRSTSLLDVTKQATDRMGKPLFVGEYGEAGRLGGEPTSFTARMLDRVVQLRVPYSAVWAWEFYQWKPYATSETREASYSLEPGVTDALINRFTQASRQLGRASSRKKALPDRSKPRVVVTWPIGCSLVRGGQLVHAIASDESGIDRVELLLDGALQATLTKSPYESMIDFSSVAEGDHTISAKAFDREKNVSEYRTRVVVGKVPTSVCPTARPR